MVCLGNICRSPLAEGILQQKVNDKGLMVEVDSCGTANYHVGEHPDPRSIKKAKQHGIDISQLHARQFSKDDFANFDLILAMDKYNLADVLSLSETKEEQAKVKLVLDFSIPGKNKSVPDPYYGDDSDFEHVFQLLDQAADVLLNQYFDEK